MGNNPSSSSKSATPVSSAAASQQDSPKHHHHHKRESKHIIPPRSAERVAAPPEPSLTQAQGSTTTKGPKPLQAIPISSFTGSPSSSSSTSVPQPKPPENKHIIRDEPSKPVDVPSAPTESSSLRSHYSAHMVEPALVSNNSVNDMSYITRPPRLPLPIEEEIHTPGSPIIAPADTGEASVVEVEALDSDGMTRKSSALSTTTVDEEDGEELIVDKTRPTVPTRLEWRRGGGKVYVTGTIFQWNRKQRLHPV